MTTTAYRPDGTRLADSGCGRCDSPDGRVDTYWGERHCGPCAQVVAAELDRTGWWPHVPWEPAGRAEDTGPVAVLDVMGWRQAGVSVDPWPYLASVELLGELCHWAGARQVWVHASALGRIGWTALPGAEPGWRASEQHDGSEGDWSNYWRDDASRQGFELCVPGWGAGPFSECATGAELARELERFTTATAGGMWHRSGAITSERMLRRMLGAGRVRVGKTAQPPPAVRDERGQKAQGEEPTFRWWRQAAEGERRARYCHAFDLNAQELGAASSLTLPVGDFEHQAEPVFDRRTPGYWLIAPPVWPELLPPPHGFRWGDPIWVTTPTMELLTSHPALEGPVRPLEAFTWPRAHQYLRGWYERLRDARAALLDGGGPALDALKETYTRGVGRLGSVDRSHGTDDPMFQPYWRHAIKAEARSRLWARLARMPLAPVAVDVDCAWFLSSKSADALAVQLGLKVGRDLGQWKHHSTLPGKVARELLEGDSPITALKDAVK